MISTFRRIVEPLPLKDARYPFPVFSSVLTFTATILLCFVALSTPWTKSVTLMDYDYNSLPPYFSPDMIREGADWYEGFGCFGYTSRGSEYSLGYEIHFRIPNFDDSKVNNALTRRLTKALILHPLAALLALTTFYTSLTTPVFSLRWTNIFLASATSVTLVTFTIDVVLWTTFRNNMSKLCT
ncbi:hypothetical protein DL96DRAFT_1589306 [Flagelloscypha sp. PMI_526]|nr:hypothetical protein DL96DRAFT_1589306 [Flagelloscypha sp. PMI_526]